MKFLVTGGAGFIGSHLARHLVSDGHKVTVLDNLARGQLSNLDDIQDKVELLNLDILDYTAMQDSIVDADCIFHQAALGSVPQSWKEPEKYYNVNAIGTENIFKLAASLDCKVVYASTSSVYGDQDKFPISEDAPLNPLNPYGKAKLQAEKFAKQYAKDGLDVIGLRYFNVYGVGQNPNYAGVIPCFIARLQDGLAPIIEGDGEQIRSFTFVDDIVDANCKAFYSDVRHGFFNIASDTVTSINSLASIMTELFGLDLAPEYTDPRPGDIKKSQADTRLAKELIGWHAKTDLKSGLQQMNI